MNFSFALIAKNEEKTLPRLLASLPRGAQVVLLDTGSTDKTVQIARDLGCIVHEVENKFRRVISQELADQVNGKLVEPGEEPVVKAGDFFFDYASARNFIAEFAPTNFIFTPDCDEVWTKFDVEKVEEAIAKGAEQLEYNFVFSHLPDGSPAIKFTHCKAYDRRKLKWVGIIHEVLQGEANRVFLGEDVLYLEHFQNAETNRSGYLRGLALDCFEHPNNDRNAHYFGRELVWTGRPKSAIKQLEKHLALSSWKAEKSQSMIFIGQAYQQLGREDEAVMWWNLSFLEDPNRREALINLAEFFKNKQEFQKAVCYARAALEIPAGNFYADMQEHYTSKPHEILYLAYWYLGRREESKIEFDKAFAYQPTNEAYLKDRKFFYPE